MSVLRGGCMCGAVTFEVTDAFRYALNCHCTQCRRATGAAFKTFGAIARNQLKVTGGGDALAIYGDEAAHDTRCGTCGSFLWSIVNDGTLAHVNYGALQDAPTLKPQAHIFVGSKAPWFEITDDLPQFEEFGD